jgi:hypothetical protein
MAVLDQHRRVACVAGLWRDLLPERVRTGVVHSDSNSGNLHVSSSTCRAAAAAAAASAKTTARWPHGNALPCGHLIAMAPHRGACSDALVQLAISCAAVTDGGCARSKLGRRARAHAILPTHPASVPVPMRLTRWLPLSVI